MSENVFIISDDNIELSDNQLNKTIGESEGKRKQLIIIRKVEVLKEKDFVEHFRCQRDIQTFLSNYRIIIDCKQTNLRDIVNQMVKHMKTERSFDVLSDVNQSLYAIKNQILVNTIQGITFAENDEYCYDQTWITAHCSIPSIKRRQICITRMTNPINIGITSHSIRFLILVLTPVKDKIVKNSEEISHTFAILFSDLYFRVDLINAKTEEEFIEVIDKRLNQLKDKSQTQLSPFEIIQKKINSKQCSFKLTFGEGVAENFKRRAAYYLSDIKDGIVDCKAVHKTLATTVSLYLAIILPCIAFGVRDNNNTNGSIDPRRALIGQAFGGLIFALFSGQPLVIIMTTAPLCLYTKVVYDISDQLEVDFFDMFACVGLWNAFFVIIFALFNVSYLMKWCTRSTEEIFGLFSFFAFLIDPIKDCAKSFEKYYCVETDVQSMSNSTQICDECSQQTSLLFLMLMLFTVWVAVTFYDFNKTPYLNQHMREIFSDYALPAAVITMSFVGSYLFQDIKVEKFQISDSFEFKIIQFKSMTLVSVLVAMTLGFSLSLLFFMDQNISAALVNNPNNKLKKGDAYHWDLLVVGILNIFLSMFGLPWMNGMLPHSPIHARSLADIQQTVDSNGRVIDVIVKGRETRITGVMTHVFIAISLFLISYLLDYIPVSVLNGLFIYCAIASLRGNSFVERMLLFLTEQSNYPSNHYIRRCPQKMIHLFTIIQIIQSGVLCYFAFSSSPYVQMAYPVIIAILIPIRAKIIPLIMNKRYIEAIDGYH